MSTRRDFLIQAAGLPAVLSLPGCSRVDAPLWLGDALKRMRESDAPGLLFRIPADAEGRCSLGHSITHHLLNSKDPEVHEVLSEAALLCLDTPALQDRFRGAKRTDTLLLVDGDGFTVDGMTFEPGDAWVNFVPAARALLHGPGGRRLAERAERARKKGSEGNLDVLLPALIEERLSAPPPRRDALRAAIERHWESKAATKMPYGVETTTQMKGGCGDCGCEEALPQTGLRVACGMAVMVKNSRHFVKFLKK